MQTVTTYPAAVIVKLKHDKGTVKIKTWAESIQQAITQVCKAENAPESAVIYAKVAPLTISDIKYLTSETAPHFFTRSTLKFFRQKMGDFSVTRHGDDKFYISAPHQHGRTERIYNPFTRKLDFV